MEEDKIKCPKCGSEQIIANKKGFSAGKAIGGALLTGGIGLLAGLHGAGKIKITCLKCGNRWAPKLENAESKKAENKNPTKKETPPLTEKQLGGCLIAFVVFIIIYYLIKTYST